MKDNTGTFPAKYTVSLENGLEACEVETGVYFNRGCGEVAVINSNDPLIVARLLTSSFFSLDRWRGKEKRGGSSEVYYVDGTIPIGAVTVSKPRAKNSISLVVKSPRKVYTEDEAKANKKKMAERLSGNKKKGDNK